MIANVIFDTVIMFVAGLELRVTRLHINIILSNCVWL